MKDTKQKLTNIFSDLFKSKSKNVQNEPSHIPFLRKLKVNYQYMIFTSLTIISAVSALGLFIYVSDRGTQLNSRVEYSVNVQMLSQRLAKNIQLGISGDDDAYKLIDVDTQLLADYLNKFKNGADGFNKLEPDLQNSIVSSLDKKYNEIVPKLLLLQRNQKTITDISKKSFELDSKIQKLISEFNLIYMLMVQRGEDNSKLTALQTLSSSTHNFNKNLGSAATSSQVDLRLVSALSADYQTVNELISSLTVKDPIQDKVLLNELITLAADNKEFFTSISEILQNIKPLLDGKKAGAETLSVFDQIFIEIDELRKISLNEKNSLGSLDVLGYLFGILTILFIFLIGYINLKEAQIRAWVTARENDETDAAVISLMEELTPISEGNLKARATITEHVIGSLADKINAMAESLQESVQNTRNTSEKVALQMFEVKEMISNASELANSAEDAARNSNDSSIAGAELVNLAAEKMEDARSKMQETSKRVKRLGEVSQSIGLVADLIEEMTEKTAILALNTQLKAAEAGSDGNSFRVIAEEIRKLSEESKKSLSTIRSNVQNMQSETNTVMLSIEQTTANVVEGSLLWEKAEKDLKLIQESASKIKKITFQLNELSNKQVEKTKETENNMIDLNKSISHFKV